MSGNQYRLTLAGVVTVLGSLVAPATAGATQPHPSTATAATRMPCAAHMSDARPRQYSTIHVLVSSWGGAAVTTEAHYKTTGTTKRGRTDPRTGRASIAYRISDATVGFKVTVNVTVHKSTHHGSCSTSFVPRPR